MDVTVIFKNSFDVTEANAHNHAKIICRRLDSKQYRYCIVAFPPSQISPRKTGYIVAFPPENWLYSSLYPGEILLYSQISPFL